MQERTGIGCLTDGEYRKGGWEELFTIIVKASGPNSRAQFPIRLAMDGAHRGRERRSPAICAAASLCAEDFSKLER